MYRSVRKWLAMALLLTIPLQGLSAVLMPLHCLTVEQHPAAAVGAHHGHEGVAHGHDKHAAAIAPHDGDAAGNDAGHLCCNHMYTGVPSVAVLTAPARPFIAVNQISTAPPLFFPEQFLRPPRP
jgi:hypothetical protein